MAARKNIELLLQMGISANQLSLYRAVADMIEEWPVGQKLRETRCTRSTGSWRDSYTTSSCRNAGQWRATGKPAARIRAKNSQKTRSYPNYAPKRVRILSKKDNSFLLFRHQEKKKINLYAENIRCLQKQKELVPKGGSKAMYDFALLRKEKFTITTEDTVLKFRFNLCLKIKPYLGFE